MLHLYVLYACVHLSARRPLPQAGRTTCTEKQVFFSADPCRRVLPKHGGLIDRSKDARSWVECKETVADSWIPADARAAGSRLYQAAAAVSDESAMAALLAPLAASARAALAAGGFAHPFQRAFQGPGNLSFFVVGNGSSVIAFAVTNLDDFQFAQMEADVSSSSAMTTEDLDFTTLAEDAGVELSYHTWMSQRAMPPPGGLETGP
jgi:hypothetical protein